MKRRGTGQPLLLTGSGSTTVITLPLEVLELISSSLALEDRVALTSCCRSLWLRPDVTTSTFLWGTIAAYGWKAQPMEVRLGLSRWLARHATAVGRLQHYGGTVGPAVALAGLQGGVLSALEVHFSHAFGLELAEAVAPLAELGSSLTELVLQSCGLSCIPPQLSALSVLQMLDLESNQGLGSAGKAAFGPLATVTQLTQLRLKACRLRRLPRQLSALASSLQHLDLANNRGLGDRVAVNSMRPLETLVALTCLDMTFCGLPCVPPQLSACTSLQRLRLGTNTMGLAGHADFEPFCHTTRLTCLDMSECSLAVLPPQLSCLSSLAAAYFRGNPALGPLLAKKPAAVSWQPLLSLAASLTSLDISHWNLAALPAEFSNLTGLESLYLSGNKLPGRGKRSATARQPLSCLPNWSWPTVASLPFQRSFSNCLSCRSSV